VAPDDVADWECIASVDATPNSPAPVMRLALFTSDRREIPLSTLLIEPPSLLDVAFDLWSRHKQDTDGWIEIQLAVCRSQRTWFLVDRKDNNIVWFLIGDQQMPTRWIDLHLRRVILAFEIRRQPECMNRPVRLPPIESARTFYRSFLLGNEQLWIESGAWALRSLFSMAMRSDLILKVNGITSGSRRLC
jgi:hypothetical protein